MYNIFLGFFQEEQKIIIRNLCNQLPHVHILECDSTLDIPSKIKIEDINLFILNLDSDDLNLSLLPMNIRKINKFKFTEMIIFSKKPELLLSICLKCINTNYFLLPFNKEIVNSFSELIHNFYTTYDLLNKDSYQYCKFCSSGSVHNILVDEILYVESCDRKSIVHTTQDVITLKSPLYKIKELLPPNRFIKTHRSFIVNPRHIYHIIKEDDSWLLKFYQSNSSALVSRSHKKDLDLYFDSIDMIKLY